MKSPVSFRVGSMAALPLEEAQQDLLKFLDQAEFEVYSGFLIPKRQIEWLAGRIWVKQLYRQVMDDGISFPSIRVERLPEGQPVLFVNGKRSGVSISISHSQGWVAAAIDPLGQAIGVDLEQIESRAEAFVGDYFTSSERDWIAATGKLSKDEKINLIWSSKESVLKALGRGLHIDPLRVDVGHIAEAEEDDRWGSAVGSVKLDTARGFVIRWQVVGEMVVTFASLEQRDLILL